MTIFLGFGAVAFVDWSVLSERVELAAPLSQAHWVANS